MIYAILDKNTNLIYFTDRSREKDDLDNTELLYTSDKVTLSSIKKDLRPWIYLWDQDYYKNDPIIKQYLETGKLDVFYVKMYPSEIKNEINKFIENLKFLNSIECTNSQIYNEDPIVNTLEYDCDIYNYLLSIYGNITDLIYKFEVLKEKNILIEFSKIKTRDKKVEFIEKNLQETNKDILEFLPLWYRLEYKIRSEKELQNILLEYKNKKSLGGNNKTKQDLKNLFFSTFELGKTYTGPEIKSMIQNIYNTFGLKKTPKISDLQEYFDITNVSSISSYRINLRK